MVLWVLHDLREPQASYNAHLAWHRYVLPALSALLHVTLFGAPISDDAVAGMYSHHPRQQPRAGPTWSEAGQPPIHYPRVELSQNAAYPKTSHAGEMPAFQEHQVLLSCNAMLCCASSISSTALLGFYHLGSGRCSTPRGVRTGYDARDAQSS